MDSHRFHKLLSLLERLFIVVFVIELFQLIFPFIIALFCEFNIYMISKLLIIFIVELKLLLRNLPFGDARQRRLNGSIFGIVKVFTFFKSLFYLKFVHQGLIPLNCGELIIFLLLFNFFDQWVFLFEWDLFPGRLFDFSLDLIEL